MIGIFGGTFDPIHYGHLLPALEVQAALRLAELRFLPAGLPPHRPPPVASAEQRLTMVRLAVAGLAGCVVDDRELRRTGPSYTVLTLRELRAELGSDRPLCLLLGMDALLGFDGWHAWREIPELAHVVVMRRPGYGPADSAGLPAWAGARLATEPDELAAAPAGRLFVKAVSPQPYSASAIRAALARSEDVSGQLPDAVLEFIRARRIYTQR